MNMAIIDIGSNTIRLNIYATEGQDYRLLLTKKHTAGLAAYVENKRLSKQGIKRLSEILSRLKRILDNVLVDEIHIFATASLRNVSNGREVMQKMAESVGLPLEIVGEDEEARLGNLAIRTKHQVKRGMSCDIGGGSTEIVQFDRETNQLYPLADGSLSLYLQFVSGIFPKAGEARAMARYIRQALPELPQSKQLLAIGGTARAAGKAIAMLKDLDSPEEAVADPHSFSYKELKDLINSLIDEEVHAVKSLLRVAPERVHTIVPGMIILREIAKKIRAKKILVCEEGVREGYLIDRLQGARHDEA